jgi:hypothetical protein
MAPIFSLVLLVPVPSRPSPPAPFGKVAEDMNNHQCNMYGSSTERLVEIARTDQFQGENEELHFPSRSQLP